MGCGQSTGPIPRLNQLTDGRTCPSCAERLLDSLPPLLPSPALELGPEGEEWAEEGEEPGDDFLKGA